MTRVTLEDKESTFEAIHLEAINPTRIVIFSVGSGGNSERHLPLLNFLADNSCTVIAPQFERIVSSIPSASELLLRSRRLQIAMNFVEPSAPVVGVGHSIGATLLLALAGGRMYMHDGQCLPIPRDDRLKKLVLFAPPTGFYRCDDALKNIEIPLQAWIGRLDTITPPEQIEFLKCSLHLQVPVDFRVMDGAGHFSFMNTLPAQIMDAMENRELFLKNLSVDVCQFIKI
jgi:pimeloyl-ACP methyl ester carboxylesterase